MAGFSSYALRLFVTGLTGVLLLSACSSSSDAALDPPKPTSRQESSASASTATATASASASALPTPSDQAAEKPAPSKTPTVTEQEPAPKQQAPAPTHAPAPTGTVVTVPAEETPATSQSTIHGTPACVLGESTVIAAQVSNNSAAGSHYITLTFTNTGASPCSIKGYPAVSYVDAAGHALGAAAAHAAEWTSNGVLLQPGHSAYATLRETRAGLFGDICQPASSSGYQVQLPGTQGTLTVPYPAEACSNPAIQQLSVGQVGANA